MSFNIRMSHGNDGINSWENRKSLLIQTLKEYDVDVIGTQEVTSEQYAFLKNQLTGYDSHAIGRKDGVLEDEITAIFYKKRFKLLTDSTIWLSETPSIIGSKSWDAALYRTVSWVRLESQDSKRFTIFNTHFDHRGEQARKESAKLIVRLIAEINHKEPVVLLGDFNVTKEALPYQILTGRWQDCISLKNARSISETAHKGGEITYNGYKDDFGRIIDFVFVSAGIDVLKHQYLNIKSEDIFISDHYPVLIEFSLNGDAVFKVKDAEPLR